MYLIDSDILIWILRGDEYYEKVLQIYKYKGILSISSLTIAEIYKNIYPEEYVKTEKLLQEFNVWDVTGLIAKQGGLSWCQYSKAIKKLSIVDCLIAATAKENNLIVVTLNSRHFPMRDIKVIDPSRKHVRG